MIDQLPVHQSGSTGTGDDSTSQNGDNRTFLVVAAIGLAATTMLVLAFRGGSLNVNSAGITMTVNPPG